jgi:hypothetical protein
MPGLGEMPRHWGAHDAKAEESDAHRLNLRLGRAVLSCSLAQVDPRRNREFVAPQPVPR